MTPVTYSSEYPSTLNPAAARLYRRAEDRPWPSAVAHMRGGDNGRVEIRPVFLRVDHCAANRSDAVDDGTSAHISKHPGTG